MNTDFELNDEQEAVLAQLLEGRNSCLLGKAGTGKSTLVRAFRRAVSGNVVFLAPTGFAALQIGGETCHSFFAIPVNDIISTGDLKPLTHLRRKLIRIVDTIAIDEVSMLRSDCFYAIDFRLREAMRKNVPFGGKQIIFCGDFCQLPPVVRSSGEIDLPAYLKSQFGGIHTFQTPLWKEAGVRTVELKKVMRQRDDRFLAILNGLRYGQSPADSTLGHWLHEEVNPLFEKNIPENETVIKLCTCNRDVDRINEEAFAKISGEPHIFQATVSGTFDNKNYPCERELQLKTGEKVMLLANDRISASIGYVNGDIGTVAAFLDGKTPAVQVSLDRGGEVTVKPFRWLQYRYEIVKNEETGKESLKSREMGSFIQLPLRAAYAITIHKSQGLTFDKMSLFLGEGCFAAGQLYTALSRCRTAAGIYLETPISVRDVIVDEEVVEQYIDWSFSTASWSRVVERHLPLIDDYLLGPYVLCHPKEQLDLSLFPVQLNWLKEIYREYRTRILNEDLLPESPERIAGEAQFLFLYRCARKLQHGNLSCNDFSTLCDYIRWLKQRRNPEAV